MRWEFGRKSDNVEDRRGSGGVSPGLVGGGLGGLILTVIALLLGVDPAIIDQVVPQDNGSSSPTQTTSQPTDEMGKFVSVVLADTEDTWNPLFRKMGANYREPKLVLFSESSTISLWLCKCCGRTILLSPRPKSIFRFKFFPRFKK